MAPIEDSNSNGEGEVEGCLAGQQLEVLDGHTSCAEQAVLDLGRSVATDQLHSLRGPVDDQDVPVTDPAGDDFRRGTGRPTDFQYAHPRPQRQGVHDCREAR